MKTTKMRKAARGENCTLRLPGCNGDPETVVLCHLPSLSGVGAKSPDWYGVFGCSACHDLLDGRRRDPDWTGIDVKLQIPRALRETWEILIDMGLIEVKQ